MLVTQQSVTTVVETLLADGISLDEITVRSVRSVLGGGSLTTIAEHLRRAKQRLFMPGLSIGKDVIDILEGRLHEVARASAQVAWRDAQDRIAELEQEVAALRAQLKTTLSAQLKTAEQEIDRLATQGEPKSEEEASSDLDGSGQPCIKEQKGATP